MVSVMDLQHHFIVSVERKTEKRAALTIAPKVSLLFLLEISHSFKGSVHDNVRRLPKFQGSIYFKNVILVVLEEMCICFLLSLLLGNVVVCSRGDTSLIVVQFPFPQCSCIALEDIDVLFSRCFHFFYVAVFPTCLFEKGNHACRIKIGRFT